MKQMLYCEEAKHTFPNRGDTIRDSSVEYVLPERETDLDGISDKTAC